MKGHVTSEEKESPKERKLEERTHKKETPEKRKRCQMKNCGSNAATRMSNTLLKTQWEENGMPKRSRDD